MIMVRKQREWMLTFTPLKLNDTAAKAKTACDDHPAARSAVPPPIAAWKTFLPSWLLLSEGSLPGQLGVRAEPGVGAAGGSVARGSAGGKVV